MKKSKHCECGNLLSYGMKCVKCGTRNPTVYRIKFQRFMDIPSHVVANGRDFEHWYSVIEGQCFIRNDLGLFICNIKKK
jgi:hypothetical protein